VSPKTGWRALSGDWGAERQPNHQTLGWARRYIPLCIRPKGPVPRYIRARVSNAAQPAAVISRDGSFCIRSEGHLKIKRVQRGLSLDAMRLGCLEAGDLYFIPTVWVALAKRSKKSCKRGLAGLNDFCHDASPLANNDAFLATIALH
jgi:hypothetical protein